MQLLTHRNYRRYSDTAVDKEALEKKRLDGLLLRNIRNRKFQEQFGLCFWCGRPMIEPENGNDHRPNVVSADHLLPKVRGGSPFDPANIVAACLECNGRKGNTPWWEFQRG